MRRIDRILAMFVAASLAVGPVAAAPPVALLKASITSANGLPLPGLEVRLVNLDTGQQVSGATDATGTFVRELTPGLYSLDTSASGHRLVRGPRVVTLAAGQLLTTAIALATQAPAGPATLALNHEAINCFVAGEFPQIDAGVQPLDQFAQGEIFFRSALSPEFYYVQVSPTVGGIAGRLPRPNLDAKSITYYIHITGKNYEETQTPEVTGRIVKNASDCEGKVAPIVPTGPAAVFAAGGVPVTSLLGFAALGGTVAAAGGVSTTALIIGGAAIVGGAIAIVATGGDDAPPASPSR